MAFFPVYMNIEGLPCLVVGGGRIALGKVEKLQEFGAKVTVIAPQILPQIREISGVTTVERTFADSDICGMSLVVAAMDDHDRNHRVAELCREAGILVNAVDQAEDCTFFFSSVVRENDLVAAFSSSGKSPVMTQYLKAQMQQILTQRLGQINDLLGEMRPLVKEMGGSYQNRKAVFEKMFSYCMEQEELPDHEALLRFLEQEKQ